MGLLAHQGGWDEALFVIVPLLVIIGLLRMARRRADRIGLGGAPTDDAESAEATKRSPDDPPSA